VCVRGAKSVWVCVCVFVVMCACVWSYVCVGFGSFVCICVFFVVQTGETLHDLRMGTAEIVVVSVIRVEEECSIAPGRWATIAYAVHYGCICHMPQHVDYSIMPQ
jgi:hypothetical protein